MTILINQVEASIDNTLLRMAGKFNFSPKKILNKRLIFDTSVVDEETVMDKISAVLMILISTTTIIG